MRYFGQRHNAPVYEEIAAMRTPVGEECRECHKQITEDDDGFEVPYLPAVPDATTFVYYHRLCMMRNILGPFAEDHLPHGDH